MKNRLFIKTFFLAIITLFFIATVSMAEEVNYVAKIGETKYETLTEAVAYANEHKDITTTIVLLQDVPEGEGIIVQEGNRIVFDLNGHTYNASHGYAGSSKTETQAFQLLKNSTIVFKNGTLSVSGVNGKMIVQNYSNLTLKDVTLDASNNSNVQYALSSNNGKVSIEGATNIRATSNNRAFDMCWAKNKGYPDGTQITVNTTGTIEGIIELDTWGTFDSDIKSTLEIKNINHVGRIVFSDHKNEYVNKLKISGGIFSSELPVEVEDGFKVVNENGKYVVTKKFIETDTPVIELNEELYELNNKVVAFELEDNEDRVTGKDFKIAYPTANIADEEILGTGKTIVVDGEEITIVVRGDITGDGRVSISDATTIIGNIVENKSIEGAFLEAVDVNNDGRARISDVTMIIAKILDMME